MTAANVGQLTDSDLSLWIAEFFRRTNPRAWHENPDFVNDPAMTVLLLEKLMESRGFVSLSRWLASPTRVCVTGQMEEGQWKADEPSTYSATDKLGRCVAESFALANHYPSTS